MKQRKVVMKVRNELVLEEYGLLKSSLAVLQFMGFFRGVTWGPNGFIKFMTDKNICLVSNTFTNESFIFFLSFWDNNLWLRNV